MAIALNRIQFKLFVRLAACLAVALVLGLAATRNGELVPARAAIALVVVAALANLLSRAFARMMVEPLEDVAEVARRIGRGDAEARLLFHLHDERDTVVGAVNRMVDSMQAELEQTRRNVQQLEAVMAEMIEGVLVLDSNDRIVLVNTSFRELFDVWGEVQGRPVVEVIRLPAVSELLSQARDGSEPVFEDLDIRGHVTRTVWGRAARFPRAGARAGTLAVFHDVTEIRRVDRVRRDFIANASHELRTPLTSIQGYAESLASGPMTPAEVEAHVAVIQRNVHRMRDLIDDLMDLSRIESGGGAPDPSRVDVVKLAQTLVSDARTRLAHAKIEARVRTPVAPTAWVDRKALEQVLENLLTNAIRYSDEGANITIDVEPRGEVLEISVADTGIGIPEEALDRIFERFYRVDASRSRAIGSTGLGLSIVRHLVQAMGGTIRVESRVGQGSRFTFTVPRDRDDSETTSATPPLS
ncbi:MAG: HAMP domain-containing protein [Deltaproteobacteria bacterium]|nr:HAMP domain-containing protein [Deltaproteobacteria bacterium]